MESTQAPARKRGRPAMSEEAKAAAQEQRIDHKYRQRMRQIDAENAKKQPVEWLLITVRQTAEALQISERTVHTLVDEGKLESIKIGGSRRIPMDAVRLLAKTGATLPASAARIAARKEENTIG
jgi:excisionase family DNA binding protein